MTRNNQPCKDQGKVLQIKEKQDQMPWNGSGLIIFKEQQWHKRSVMLEENWQGESSTKWNWSIR